MKITTTAQRTVIPQTELCQNLPLSFVGELLSTILSDDDEGIVATGKSQNFLYDIGTAIQVDSELKATITEIQVKKQDAAVEINMTGTIKSATETHLPCNLFFYMWWDHTQPSPLNDKRIQNLQPLSLHIHQESVSEPLSDSVFELDIYRKQDPLQHCYLGQGRGYLVFGRPTHCTPD